jgi:Transglutaminase-like superfamily
MQKLRGSPASGAMGGPRALALALKARGRAFLRWFARARDWVAMPALHAARLGRAVAAAIAYLPGGRNFLIRMAEYCARHAEILPEALRHPLLDAVIPSVLDLFGVESMHATAVLTDYGACAFIGPTGSGKSTLGASFALAGVPILGDDCVGLRLGDGGQILLTPRHPGARLRIDSLKALGIDSGRSRGTAGRKSKRRALDPHATFAANPYPLARIFCLSRCDGVESAAGPPEIEPLSPAQAFADLSCACIRWNPTDRAANLRKFRFIEQVVARVPVKKLTLASDFGALPAVREKVLAEMRGCGRESAGSRKSAGQRAEAPQASAVRIHPAMARIRRLRRLSAADWMMIPRAWAAVIAARAGLLMVPFARVRDWADAPGRETDCVRDQEALAARVGRTVAAASACVPGGRNCLVRAIAAQRIMRVLGLPGELRIGASKGPAGELAAHAWVECAGRMVIGGAFEPGRYATLFSTRHHVAAATDPRP